MINTRSLIFEKVFFQKIGNKFPLAPMKIVVHRQHVAAIDDSVDVIFFGEFKQSSILKLVAMEIGCE